jgi:hypothetical protein
LKYAIVLVTLAAAGAASGQVVFNNPWDANQSDAGGFSQPSQILAGEFDLTGNAAVSGASWRGTMFSADPLDTGDTWNFDVIFYNDNGGVPGGSFATQSVVALVTDTGVDISGERVYIFDASFAPVNMSGSTTYFFTALNTGATETFRWNMGTDTSYSAWFSTDGGGNWNDLDTRSPLNFSLSVPAPGALALLGFAGIAATRRRR